MPQDGTSQEARPVEACRKGGYSDVGLGKRGYVERPRIICVSHHFSCNTIAPLSLSETIACVLEG